ncbi:hypothetical protein Micbo1qcDRAFT_61367 [Microdochium bolleyi]|uniref:Aminoglycoside phosphotransferase domain-containing protein n=1 Tax=Microdochium bolleyi TaxID=196109 RepID=A0A136J562_9PEZI|nr:hypothetical protein Micbo1qcDRAFT_61367 [Microdochium bolleyi]
MYGREMHDDLAWGKNEEESDKGFNLMRSERFVRTVEALVAEKTGQAGEMNLNLLSGGCNTIYRIRLADTGSRVVVRLPWRGVVQYPADKTRQEAATASFLAEQTQLPIPRPLHHGQDSPVGPFIIMPWVGCRTLLSHRLAGPGPRHSSTHVLDPAVTDDTLLMLWPPVARSMLQMSRIALPRIGSLLETSPGAYEVADRPITKNMNDMVQLANIPRCVLPQQGTTYATAAEWYAALADMHIAQLVFQRNDLVWSEDDCRNKYVARQLFRRLSREGKLSTFGFAEDTWSAQSASRRAQAPQELAPAPSEIDFFRIWCDDFRPSNILLTESDDVAAFIDWEYAYSAPTQFILDPPWWLLLQTMEWWEDGIDSWIETYEGRLETWLAAMEKAEEAASEDVEWQQHPSDSRLPATLSRYMRESWETGRFFLSYAARNSWMFDAMYWRFLDERFFGARAEETVKNDLWKTRVHLLSEEEWDAMEDLVQRKMAEKEEGDQIVHWEEAEAKRLLETFLHD